MVVARACEGREGGGLGFPMSTPPPIPPSVPILPGDPVSHLPPDEQAAALEYQRLGLPYYPTDPDGF